MFTYEYMIWRKHGRIYSRLSPEVKWGRMRVDEIKQKRKREKRTKKDTLYLYDYISTFI